MKRSQFLLVALSIFTCLVIAVFLGIWLNDQYLLEEKRMEETIKKDLIVASDKVTEKMMYDLLKDPNGFKVKMNDTIGFTTSQKTFSSEIGAEKKGKATVRIVVRTSDSSRPIMEHVIDNKHNKNYFIKRTENKVQQVVVHSTEQNKLKDLDEINGLFSKGLKVFVNQLASVKSNGNITQVTKQPLDTNLFKRTLNREWSNKALAYHFDFKRKKRTEDKVYFSAPALFDQHAAIVLKNRKAYLIETIVPEASFVFAILGILIFSFWWFFRSMNKQAQLNQMRLDFMHNMSHELKTPVSTVKIALEALNKYDQKKDPMVMNDYLNVMEHEVNRLDELVKKVLQTNLKDAPEWMLNIEQIDLVPVLSRTIEQLQLQPKWKQVQLNFLHTDNNLYVQADAFHVEGIVMNILDNALKYAGSNVNIELKAYLEKDSVFIEIGDNGPGIPKEYEDLIFDAFVRVPAKNNTHNVKGYGLGLNYCKKMMQMQNGSITYKGNRPQGACFVLQFKRN